jgi:hypothetical protein
MIRRMEAPGPHDHLRHSALELLASGNGSDAVAGLLQVPVDEVVRWQGEPEPKPLEPAAMLAATRAQGRPIGFRTRLVVAEPTRLRLWKIALAVWFGGSVAVALADSLRESGSHWADHDAVWINLAFMVGCAGWLWRLSQPLLLLDAQSLVVPGLLGRTTLAYSDLADWWLVGHVEREGTDDEREGRLLTLHSLRPGVAPATVFIDDGVALDPRVLERLELVKQANQGPRPLARLGA